VVRGGFVFAEPTASFDVYVIIDQGLCASSSIDVGRLMKHLSDAGAGAIQYRAKNLSKAKYYQDIQPLLSLARSFRIPLFVNDHLDIALALRTDGIHLGQNDLPYEAAQKLLPENMILGVSTHSLEQAVAAARLKPGYMAIGPVFPTTTKANPDPVVGTDSIRNIKASIGSIPLIAIGGITLENAAEVIRSGADGVAVASCVIQAKEPAIAVQVLKERVAVAKAAREMN